MIEGIKIFGYVKKSKKIYMVVGTNLWLLEQEPMLVGTRTYGCENKST
jgi:hypothetical protein